VRTLTTAGDQLERIVDELATALRTGRVRRIVAPGGFGKSHLLDVVLHRVSDLPLQRWSAGLEDEPPAPSDMPLVVDDAHLADGELLRALAAARPALLVAHRPIGGGRARALDLLDRTPLVLAPLDHDAVRDLLERWWGERPSPTVTDGLLVATAGVPRLLYAVTGDGPSAWVRATPMLEELLRAERRALSESAARVLLVAAVLDGLERHTQLQACGLCDDTFDAACQELVAAGLAVGSQPRLIPIVAETLPRIWSATDLAALADRAVEALDEDGPAIVGERLLAAGATGPAIGRCLLAASHRAAAADPQRAVDLLAAAQQAAASPAEVTMTAALVAFHDARLDDTLTALDRVLDVPPGWLRDETCRAVGTVLATRGAWRRAAQVVEDRPGYPSHNTDLEVLSWIAAGEVARAREVGGRRPLEGQDPRAGRTSVLITGLLASLDDDASGCLLTLLEAARLEALEPPAIPLPEQTQALAAIVAINLGELDIAADLLAQRPPVSAPWTERRHRLLTAWIVLRRGDWSGAEALVEQVHASSSWASAEARDRLLALAIRAGAARRRGDLDTLLLVWRQARTELLRTPPDLLGVGPVGELLIAGARLGDRGTVTSCRRRVDELLDRAGAPPLWSLPVRWDQVHLAIALDDPIAARTAADALAALSPAGPRVAVLGEVASIWVDAIEGRVEADRVRREAARLADTGLVWEASRLAGAAAIRTRDGAEMRGLLHFARSLPAPSSPSLVDGAHELSAREREVAAHLLAGLTYRQIGAQLFIAPKTVEHHVSRIRRKLGATSRAELLFLLRRHLPTEGSLDAS